MKKIVQSLQDVNKNLLIIEKKSDLFHGNLTETLKYSAEIKAL